MPTEMTDDAENPGEDSMDAVEYMVALGGLVGGLVGGWLFILIWIGVCVFTPVCVRVPSWEGYGEMDRV